VTLFASVARTMSAAHDEELSRLADIGEKLLLLADAQGFAPCQQTLQQLA
jgi:hypothetical protein